MLKRQTTGSVVCPGCGRLVGVNDEACLSCGRRNPSLWGFGPGLGKLVENLAFHELVLWVCALLYLATLLYKPDQIGMGGLFSILQPAGESLLRFGMSGKVPVFDLGRWWTVLSAAWLHGGLLHIVFNMMWIRQLAPAVSELYGASRLILIYTAGAVGGFALTSFMALLPLPGPLSGAFFTVGASAPLFGLFGALYQYGRRSGSSALSQQYMQFLVIWLVIGVIAGFSPQNAIRIDNWAHLGGFLGGMGAAWLLDPLKPEKPAHTIGALACLAASLLSIVASFLVW